MHPTQLNPSRRCPNCTESMMQHSFARHYRGEVDIDACDPCTLFWLDQGESTQLSPQSTVDIFKLVHEQSSHAPNALKSRLNCPRCVKPLITTQDNVLGTRFQYFRCPAEHGRLITFTHFLAEKRFIRELSPVERMRLSERIKSIRCEGCGANVDLAHNSACTFCSAPIRMFDQDAAMKAMEHYVAVGNAQTHARSPQTNDDALGERFADLILAQSRLEARRAESAVEVDVVRLIGAGIGAFLGALGSL